MTALRVAVAGGPAATAFELAAHAHEVTLVALEPPAPADVARCAREGIDVVLAEPLDVRVTTRWLEPSYRLYRALRDGGYDAVVFEGRGADAYCAGRAKETGTALATTMLVVRYGIPTLRSIGDRSFIPHHDVGVAVTERLALPLCDGVVADAETVRWMRDQGWTLPQVLDSVASLDADVASAPPLDTAAPLVSVVIPLYERTQYLPTCLEALARQDYDNLEVLLADDGSPSPAVGELLADLERRSWPWRLRVERLGHGGLASARNGGWRSASGDLVLFVDDDDVAFDDLVSTTVRALRTARADVVVGGARTFDGDEPPEPRPGDRVTISLCEPGELTLFGNHSGGPTCLWSRSWLDRLEGFSARPRVVEDWHILVRASVAGARITTSPDPVWWYRRTATSMFTSDPDGALDAAVPAMAGLVAATLPPHHALLPQLVAGAYRELERRDNQSRPSTPSIVRRTCAVTGRAAARLRRLRN